MRRVKETAGQKFFLKWLEADPMKSAQSVQTRRKDVAERCDVSRQAVDWWARGICIPSEPHRRTIAVVTRRAVPESSWTRED